MKCCHATRHFDLSATSIRLERIFLFALFDYRSWLRSVLFKSHLFRFHHLVRWRWLFFNRCNLFRFNCEKIDLIFGKIVYFIKDFVCLRLINLRALARFLFVWARRISWLLIEELVLLLTVKVLRILNWSSMSPKTISRSANNWLNLWTYFIRVANQYVREILGFLWATRLLFSARKKLVWANA